MSFLNRIKNSAVSGAQQSINQAARQVGNAAAQQVAGAISANTGQGDNKSWNFVFAEIPVNLEQLRSLPEASLSEPHYAAALLIPALCLWTINQQEAIAMINFLKGPEALSNRDIQFMNDRLKGKEYVAPSYFVGATPQNNYEPSEPYTLVISTNPYSYAQSGYVKLFMSSGGADSPRPLSVRQKPSTGEWFLWEQHLLSDIRPPAAQDPWA
ncbi:MAG: hypothetical protein FWE76_07630 [Symbiobacteriaceae bacterium]|nr:hypothetical protein [Symbiobacteriaceae bacterium]